MKLSTQICSPKNTYVHHNPFHNSLMVLSFQLHFVRHHSSALYRRAANHIRLFTETRSRIHVQRTTAANFYADSQYFPVDLWHVRAFDENNRKFVWTFYSMCPCVPGYWSEESHKTTATRAVLFNLSRAGQQLIVSISNLFT